MTIFPTFFFRQYGLGKCVLPYSRTRKTPFQALKKKFKNRKTDIFSKGLNHRFAIKTPIFPTFLCQAIQARKMCFTIFQDEIKTRSSKNRKIEIFPNGLTDGFGPKITIFANFYFQLIKARKMCFTIFQNEKTTSSLKKQRGSKTRKMAIFGPKPWVNPFGKISIFRLFELLVFIAQKGVFSFQNIIKYIFRAYIA